MLVLNSGRPKDEDLRRKTGNLFHSAGPANTYKGTVSKFSIWGHKTSTSNLRKGKDIFIIILYALGREL